MKTTIVKESEVKRAWRLVDARDKPVGRLAVEIVRALRGKDRPTYTPNADMGDAIVVVNAVEVRLTGRKEEQKIYTSYSGYPGGLKKITAAAVRRSHPERLILHAVKGMLPDNRLARRMLRRVKVYPGPEHPHAAQQPKAWQVAI